MTKRSRADKRRVATWGVAVLGALFAWSFVASPQTGHSADADVLEPSSLTAYDASADAAPIRGLIQHNVYLYTAEPAFAHSTSEVSLPSQATSTTWLLDLGILNGVNGTTTGNKVPTETTATQPGGAPSEEFVVQRQPVGNDATLRFGAGVSRAEAVHSNRPRGYGHSYLANVALLPAPGSPDDPPGSYDPQGDAAKEQEHPPTASPSADDKNAYTPNPKGQMAILSIGSIASTTETYREEGKAVAVSVAELSGVNIGNRTADGRCTNCITINSIRVEARAESDGTAEGALASWRVLIHRACRVAITNDPRTGAAYEGVSCLDPNPDEMIEAHDEESVADPNARGVRKIETLEQINKGFDQLAKGLGVSSLGISLHAGTTADNAATTSATSSAASARGVVLEVNTTAAGEVLSRIAPSLASVVQAGDTACAAAAQEVSKAPPVPGAPAVAVPGACASGAVESGRTRRTLRLALGQVSAVATAVPASEGPIDGGGSAEPGTPGFTIPSFNIPAFNIPASQGGGSNTYIQGSGLQPGPLALKIDWSSVRLKPWKPKDMAKGIFGGALIALLWALARRRRALRL